MQIYTIFLVLLHISPQNCTTFWTSRTGLFSTFAPREPHTPNIPPMDFEERIKKLMALLADTEFEGERVAAQAAIDRLAKNVTAEAPKLHETEFRLTTSSDWQKRLLMAICHKHGLKPYRYHRQKYTTVMVRVNEGFLNRVVWPEYLKFSGLLSELVDDITIDLISKIHHHEEEVVIAGELE
jgi:hypothetical protein